MDGGRGESGSAGSVPGATPGCTSPSGTASGAGRHAPRAPRRRGEEVRVAPAAVLSPAQADRLAERFPTLYPAWTWPEVLRALHDLLPGWPEPGLADEVARRLFDAAPWEPDDPTGLLRAVLQPWTSSPSAQASSTSVDLTPRTASGDLHPGVPAIDSLEALAQWLDLTAAELDWFRDAWTWLRTARQPLRHYRIWRRAKRDGHRVIEAPKPRMREVQRRILREILDHVPPHPAARGFVRGSDTSAFAWPHAGRAVVLRVDLRHCFEHVTEPRVRAVFRDIGYPPGVARALAQLCTTTTPVGDLRGLDPVHAALLRRRHLPQGAPTSPVLANLTLRRLDARLAGYAARNGLRYTRYGDDLAMSDGAWSGGARPDAAMDAGRALWVILRVAHDEGMTVHAGKTRVMRAHQRQRLAGLVVNDRPQVARAEYDALRALLHNAARTGAAAQNRDGHADFRAHVLGRIAWVGTGSPARREKLLRMAAVVDWGR